MAKKICPECGAELPNSLFEIDRSAYVDEMEVDTESMWISYVLYCPECDNGFFWRYMTELVSIIITDDKGNCKTYNAEELEKVECPYCQEVLEVYAEDHEDGMNNKEELEGNVIRIHKSCECNGRHFTKTYVGRITSIQIEGEESVEEYEFID